MRIKEGMEAKWKECVVNNSKDGYSKAGIDYVIRWANLMEAYIDNSRLSIDKVMSERAEQLSHDADNDGITGFQYGCAVSLLSQVWEYGEYLRVWHNVEYGHYGDGVVNPAVMTVG